MHPNFHRFDGTVFESRGSGDEFREERVSLYCPKAQFMHLFLPAPIWAPNANRWNQWDQDPNSQPIVTNYRDALRLFGEFAHRLDSYCKGVSQDSCFPRAHQMSIQTVTMVPKEEFFKDKEVARQRLLQHGDDEKNGMNRSEAVKQTTVRRLDDLAGFIITVSFAQNGDEDEDLDKTLPPEPTPAQSERVKKLKFERLVMKCPEVYLQHKVTQTETQGATKQAAGTRHYTPRNAHATGMPLTRSGLICIFAEYVPDARTANFSDAPITKIATSGSALNPWNVFTLRNALTKARRYGCDPAFCDEKNWKHSIGPIQYGTFPFNGRFTDRVLGAELLYSVLQFRYFPFHLRSSAAFIQGRCATIWKKEKTPHPDELKNISAKEDPKQLMEAALAQSAVMTGASTVAFQSLEGISFENIDEGMILRAQLEEEAPGDFQKAALLEEKLELQAATRFGEIWNSSNSDLPNAHAALAKRFEQLREKYPSMTMPIPRKTSNLSSWGEIVTFLSEYLEAGEKLQAQHAITSAVLFSLLHVYCMEATFHINPLILGPQAAGKSTIGDVAERMFVKGTLTTKQSQTSKATHLANNKHLTGQIRVWSEMDPGLLLGGAGFKGGKDANTTEQARFREWLTSMNIEFERLEKDGHDGPMYAARVLMKDNSVLMAFGNALGGDFAENMRSRFALFNLNYLPHPHRSLIERAQATVGKPSEITEQMQNRVKDWWQRNQIFVCFVYFMIKTCKAWKIQSKATDDFVAKTLDRIGMHSQVSLTRARNMVTILIEICTIVEALYKFLDSALSPLRHNPDKCARFEWTHFVTYQFKVLLVSRIEHAIWAMDQLKDNFDHTDVHGAMQAAIRAFGITKFMSADVRKEYDERKSSKQFTDNSIDDDEMMNAYESAKDKRLKELKEKNAKGRSKSQKRKTAESKAHEDRKQMKMLLANHVESSRQAQIDFAEAMGAQGAQEQFEQFKEEQQPTIDKAIAKQQRLSSEAKDKSAEMDGEPDGKSEQTTNKAHNNNPSSDSLESAVLPDNCMVPESHGLFVARMQAIGYVQVKLARPLNRKTMTTDEKSMLQRAAEFITQHHRGRPSIASVSKALHKAQERKCLSSQDHITLVDAICYESSPESDFMFIHKDILDQHRDDVIWNAALPFLCQDAVFDEQCTTVERKVGNDKVVERFCTYLRGDVDVNPAFYRISTVTEADVETHKPRGTRYMFNNLYVDPAVMRSMDRFTSVVPMDLSTDEPRDGKDASSSSSASSAMFHTANLTQQLNLPVTSIDCGLFEFSVQKQLSDAKTTTDQLLRAYWKQMIFLIEGFKNGKWNMTRAIESHGDDDWFDSVMKNVNRIQRRKLNDPAEVDDIQRKEKLGEFIEYALIDADNVLKEMREFEKVLVYPNEFQTSRRDFRQKISDKLREDGIAEVTSMKKQMAALRAIRNQTVAMPSEFLAYYKKQVKETEEFQKRRAILPDIALELESAAPSNNHNELKRSRSHLNGSSSSSSSSNAEDNEDGGVMTPTRSSSSSNEGDGERTRDARARFAQQRASHTGLGPSPLKLRADPSICAGADPQAKLMRRVSAQRIQAERKQHANQFISELFSANGHAPPPAAPSESDMDDEDYNSRSSDSPDPPRPRQIGDGQREFFRSYHQAPAQAIIDRLHARSAEEGYEDDEGAEEGLIPRPPSPEDIEGIDDDAKDEESSKEQVEGEPKNDVGEEDDESFDSPLRIPRPPRDKSKGVRRQLFDINDLLEQKRQEQKEEEDERRQLRDSIDLMDTDGEDDDEEGDEEVEAETKEPRQHKRRQIDEEDDEPDYIDKVGDKPLEQAEEGEEEIDNVTFTEQTEEFVKLYTNYLRGQWIPEQDGFALEAIKKKTAKSMYQTCVSKPVRKVLKKEYNGTWLSNKMTAIVEQLAAEFRSSSASPSRKRKLDAEDDLSGEQEQYEEQEQNQQPAAKRARRVIEEQEEEEEGREETIEDPTEEPGAPSESSGANDDGNAEQSVAMEDVDEPPLQLSEPSEASQSVQDNVVAMDCST